MIWFAICEGKTEEEQDQIKTRIFDLSNHSSPLKSLKVELSPRNTALKSETELDPSPASGEKKTLGKKTDYIPPWWQGEKAAYLNAKAAMKGVSSLPKMKR